MVPLFWISCGSVMTCKLLFCHALTTKRLTCHRQRGCVLDLGLDHPFGCIGFVDHTWTDKDNDLFVHAGIPPRWYGKERSDTTLIAMFVAQSEWVDGLLPTEFTEHRIKAYRESTTRGQNPRQSLVLGKFFCPETDVAAKRNFLFPTEVLPKVYRGAHRSGRTTNGNVS